MKFILILLLSTITISLSAQKKDSTGAFIIDSATASFVFQLIEKSFDSKKETKDYLEAFSKKLISIRIPLQPADKPKRKQ